ncbi:hypothetical protein FIBSPDRAFT_937807 [Athelia psychrophila]|uniref:non-specific serine/threonine protein kinase n=1 Tax=Athelia psychrophila TaxID=1759441 RepID=A0A165ZRP0_9AGAM|nr:hypothetical protein FIBSPDRAFT_937807 [Fibularhizoctonia sp. CBS 109695]
MDGCRRCCGNWRKRKADAARMKLILALLAIRTMSLKLFCVVYPDHDEPSPSQVTASGDDTIGDLKKVIRAAKSPDLQDIDADRLALWKLEPCIPIDDNLQTALKDVKFDGSWTGAKKLGPAKMIENIFPDAPTREHLHVLVQVPLPASKKRPYSPPTSSPMPSVKRAREEHNNRFATAAPSTTGIAQQFSKNQNQPEQYFEVLSNILSQFDPQNIVKLHPVELANGVGQHFDRFRQRATSKTGHGTTSGIADHHGPYAYCNRPATASSIPVTLLHPVFGTFVDECSTYSPTDRDNAFVTELSTAMSHLFPLEVDRRDLFLEIINRHYDLGLEPAELAGGPYRTGGHCIEGGHMYCLTQAKDELGGGGADPYLQGCAYYRELAMRRNTTDYFSSLPCLLIYYSGASFGFAGLASTDRPHLDALGPILPLSCHVHDIKMRTTIARFFGACKHAVDSLKTYYSNELPTLRNRDSLFLPDPCFPYPTSYTSLTGDKSPQTFEYTGRFSPADLDRLIFYGKSVGGSNGEQQLFIKFTRSYSKAAHQCCAQAGYAPILHGFVELPGGWYMAVMENLAKDTYPMYQFDLEAEQRRKISRDLRACIDLLHGQEMVHGDLRDSNVLVSKDDALQISLIDFDWAGEMDVVRYPISLNRQDIYRPASARDGAPITKEHDIEMIDWMFREGKFAPGGSLVKV